ncbi:hypothetical protein AHAS_Ahas14G0193200 [Arachis hypogaea]
MSHTKEVHLSGIPNSTKIGISYAIWTALTRWIPTVMEATKTSFHTEIGSTGMELDSVGELMAIEEKGLPPTKASPLCARFRILFSLCPIPSTSLQTLFFVPSNIPSLLSQEFTEFTDRIRLHTGGANLSMKAGFGVLHRCRDPPCQRCPYSMTNTNICGVRNTG